jgi:cytidylate kinase
MPFGARIVAIDGPSASGKSSTARSVALALGFAHLDSGALYRGMTLVALREGWGAPGGPLDAAALIRAAERRGLTLHFDGEHFAVYLEGEPVDEAIRGPEVTALVSPVAALPAIREWVTGRLRQQARAGRPLVVDGRDIGTVVFPDAELKVFLNASPRARAERRLRQRGEPVEGSALERETALLAARDAADAGRAVAPLRSAPDAILIDGTHLSLEEQVSQIVQRARERFG